MAQNVTVAGASYADVPAVELPVTGGGTAVFSDTSDANAAASDIAQGKTAYVNGVKLTGTASGGGSYGKATTTLASTASSISFTGLTGAPTAFAVVVKASLTTASRIVCVVHDGADTFGAYSASKGTTYNGTLFTYSYSSGTLTVTVSGFGNYFHNATYELLYTTASPASSWTLLGSTDLTVSTTSTTATSVGSLSIGSDAYTSAKIIYVKVRDKAGPRAGYFLGSDAFFINPYPLGSMGTFSNAGRIIHRYTSAQAYETYSTGGTTGYGVYGSNISSSGEVTIYRRYSSNYSLTINGTYNVEVYALDYAPNQGNPFDYSFSN